MECGIKDIETRVLELLKLLKNGKVVRIEVDRDKDKFYVKYTGKDSYTIRD